MSKVERWVSKYVLSLGVSGTKVEEEEEEETEEEKEGMKEIMRNRENVRTIVGVKLKYKEGWICVVCEWGGRRSIGQ